jgi:biopolymer transport protein ExbD
VPSFILHSSSFILHPSSFILHPSSFILHPSSFILHPSSFILPPMAVKRRELNISAEGDMTPMIDMTFQLIAFFMVLLNFAENDADARIKLPSSELAKPPDTPLESPLILQLAKNGAVLMGGDEVPVAEMGERLRIEAAVLQRQGKPVSEAAVVIRADAVAKTGSVQELIKQCQGVGFEKFTLRVTQTSGP